MALPRITATGTLVADPELRHSKTGDAVISFRLACNESKKNDHGEWENGRQIFFNVSAWRATADHAIEELTKGSHVTVEGRLHEREYTDRDGNPRRSLELDADTIARTYGRGRMTNTQPARHADPDPDPF